jgi:hypothetical protein
VERLNGGRDNLHTIVRDVFRNQFGADGVDDQLATLIDAIKDALNRVSESQ